MDAKTAYEKIMSTTEIGETVVLIEKERNKYERTKNGLRLIQRETLEVTSTHPHPQSQ